MWWLLLTAAGVSSAYAIWRSFAKSSSKNSSLLPQTNNDSVEVSVPLVF